MPKTKIQKKYIKDLSYIKDCKNGTWWSKLVFATVRGMRQNLYFNDKKMLSYTIRQMRNIISDIVCLRLAQYP